MAQWRRSLTVLLGDLVLVLRVHMMAHNPMQFQIQRIQHTPLASLAIACTKHPYMNYKKDRISKVFNLKIIKLFYAPPQKKATTTTTNPQPIVFFSRLVPTYFDFPSKL